MKKFVAIMVFAGACALAAESIPEGAKEISPYTYTYTDVDGKTWMYRQTPFGVTKWQESDIPKPTTPPQPNPVKTTDLGDKIRFERQTPFGHFVWTKKKSQLSVDEKILMQQAAEKP